MARENERGYKNEEKKGKKEKEKKRNKRDYLITEEEEYEIITSMSELSKID